MREHTRNRLLGVIALVGLLLLVIPMLFDEPGIERRPLPPLETPSPPREARQLVLALDPDSVGWAFMAEGGVQLEQRLSARPEYEVVETLPAPGSAPALDADGLPVAWVLLIDTLTEQDPALALRDELLAAAYNAYVDKAGEDYRVLVGPLLDPDTLRALRADLVAGQALEPRVLRFRLPRSGGGQ